jgi:hypothetical protein
MTKDEALKMALKDHEEIMMHAGILYPREFGKSFSKTYDAIKEALEQPAQEPVAWMNDIAFSMDKELLGTRSRIVPLYIHPAPAWQRLSDDEINKIIAYHWGQTKDWVRAIEQALKEKNNAV